jgi:hypothetical protein
MSFIYEIMDQAKEKIQMNFGSVKKDTDYLFYYQLMQNVYFTFILFNLM